MATLLDITFSGGDETPLAAPFATAAGIASGVRKLGGKAAAAGANVFSVSYDASHTYPQDHQSTVYIDTLGGSDCGAAARCTNDGCYFITASPGVIKVYKRAGTYYELGTVTGHVYTAGKHYTLRATGGTPTTLRVYEDDVQIGGSIVDDGTTYGACLLTGGAGMSMYDGTSRIGRFIGADLTAGDTTAPTLSAATGAGGSAVCSGSVSTNEANGTLYIVVTGSATAPSAAQVMAGQDHTGAAALRAVSQAVTATGTQTLASGAVTSGTRYIHYMHRDASGNNSTVASTASFTVTAAGDTTEPTTGTISIGTVTHNSIQFSWVAGADNVGVTSYEVSSNSGGTWSDVGNVLTHTFSGLTPNTAYGLRVRAKDAAGNVDSTPSSASQTTLQAFATTFSFTATGATSLTGLKGALFAGVTPDLWGAPMAAFNNETTDGAGLCVIDVTGQTVRRIGELGSCFITNSDGTTSTSGTQAATRRTAYHVGAFS